MTFSNQQSYIFCFFSRGHQFSVRCTDFLQIMSEIIFEKPTRPLIQQTTLRASGWKMIALDLVIMTEKNPSDPNRDFGKCESVSVREINIWLPSCLVFLHTVIVALPFHGKYNLKQDELFIYSWLQLQLFHWRIFISAPENSISRAYTGHYAVQNNQFKEEKFSYGFSEFHLTLLNCSHY